jgi:hypothetical protein
MIQPCLGQVRFVMIFVAFHMGSHEIHSYYSKILLGIGETPLI